MRRAGLIPALLALLLPAGAGRADGLDIYKKNCSVCHQAGGVGLPGSFPRLAGRADMLARQPAGRTLMISAVLFGMAGRLELDGKTIVGVMPPLPRLSDDDLAAVLTHIASLEGGKAAPFTAAEVATLRAGVKKSPTEVNAMARALHGGG